MTELTSQNKKNNWKEELPAAQSPPSTTYFRDTTNSNMLVEVQNRNNTVHQNQIPSMRSFTCSADRAQLKTNI